MSNVNSSNDVLPFEKVSSTGGNTALYETAYKGGKRGTKKVKKSGTKRVKKGFFSSLKKMFKMPNFRRRKTSKR